MTIYKGTGSMFDAGADGLVNAVNCVGVMGGGLAKVFADKWPRMNADYITYCNEGLLTPGNIHSYFSNLESQEVILNFPTKDDYRDPSELEYIEKGMPSLMNVAITLGLTKVAIPALGCGLGGLDWKDVYPIIERYIEMVPGIDWIVYDPK